MIEGLIKQAYRFTEAEDCFRNISKDVILELYTELDYVYSLLESIDIVDSYSKHEILYDFEVVTGLYGVQLVKNLDNGKVVEISPKSIINGLTSRFKKIV